MAPQTRKRKAVAQSESSAKRVKSSSKDEAEVNVVGGMNGDYRVTGAEQSEDYHSFTVPGPKGKEIPCQSWGGQTKHQPTLIFTHGAGGGIDNPATRCFTQGYAQKGDVVLFQGTMNLKSRVGTFGSVLEHRQNASSENSFVVGGRSMGARAAVIVATEDEEIKKLVLVSYPLTSPKGEDRDQILLDLPNDKEVLFVSGSQDSMCDVQKLIKVMKKMKAKSRLLVVDGADHGMSLGSGTGVKGKDKDKVTEALRKLSGEIAAQWVENSKNLKGAQISAADVIDNDSQHGGPDDFVETPPAELEPEPIKKRKSSKKKAKE